MNLDAFRAFLTGESYSDPNVGPWWPQTFDSALRAVGGDWPATAFTMIGSARLRHLQVCVRTVITEGIPGDLVECGVWRGGAVMLMRAALDALGATNRLVWAADSFAGLPPGDLPQDAGDPHHTFELLRVPLDQVLSNFAKASAVIGYPLIQGVRFLPGWFKDTLPRAPIDRLAILRLDGDMYGSTTDCLTSLYPKLSPGGFLIIDDWNLAACRAAVHDYASGHQLNFDLQPIDNSSVFFRRPLCPT